MPTKTASSFGLTAFLSNIIDGRLSELTDIVKENTVQKLTSLKNNAFNYLHSHSPSQVHSSDEINVLNRPRVSELIK